MREGGEGKERSAGEGTEGDRRGRDKKVRKRKTQVQKG